MHEQLSPEEILTLQLASQGVHAKKIAERLNISLRTFRWLNAALFRKLNAKNHTNAVAISQRKGYINGFSDFSPSKTFSLSPREMQIIELIAEGKHNKEIAKELKISALTVKAQVSSILRRLQVKNRIQAVSICLTLGIIE